MASKNFQMETDVFWTREDSDDSQLSLVNVPGVSMPGNRRPKPKVKCRKTREVKATIPQKQPIHVQNLTPRKSLEPIPAAAASDDTDGEVQEKQPQKRRNHHRKASLKDLCAEDKKRVANLIRELARVGQEKEVTESRLEEERSRFEKQMCNLLDQQDTLLQDRELVQKQLLECQELLVRYQKQVLEMSDRAQSSGPNTPRKDNESEKKTTPSKRSPKQQSLTTQTNTDTGLSQPQTTSHGYSSGNFTELSSMPESGNFMSHQFSSSQSYQPCHSVNNMTAYTLPSSLTHHSTLPAPPHPGWYGPTQYPPTWTHPGFPNPGAKTAMDSSNGSYGPDLWAQRYHVPSEMPPHRAFTQYIDNQIAQEMGGYPVSNTSQQGQHSMYGPSVTNSLSVSNGAGHHPARYASYGNDHQRATPVPGPQVQHQAGGGFHHPHQLQQHGNRSVGTTSQDSATLPEPLLSSTICQDSPRVYPEEPFILKPQKAKEEFHPLLRDFSPRSSVHSEMSTEGQIQDHRLLSSYLPRSSRVPAATHPDAIASPIQHAPPITSAASGSHDSDSKNKTHGKSATRFSDLPSSERKKQLMEQKEMLLAEQERLRRVLTEQEALLHSKQHQLRMQQSQQQKRLQYFEKNGQFPLVDTLGSTANSSADNQRTRGDSRDVNGFHDEPWQRDAVNDGFDRLQLSEAVTSRPDATATPPRRTYHMIDSSAAHQTPVKSPYNHSMKKSNPTNYSPTNSHQRAHSYEAYPPKSYNSVVDVMDGLENGHRHVTFYGNSEEAANLSSGGLNISGMSVQEILEEQDAVAEESRVLEEVFFIR